MRLAIVFVVVFGCSFESAPWPDAKRRDTSRLLDAAELEQLDAAALLDAGGAADGALEQLDAAAQLDAGGAADGALEQLDAAAQLDAGGALDSGRVVCRLLVCAGAGGAAGGAAGAAGGWCGAWPCP